MNSLPADSAYSGGSTIGTKFKYRWTVGIKISIKSTGRKILYFAQLLENEQLNFELHNFYNL